MFLGGPSISWVIGIGIEIGHLVLGIGYVICSDFDCHLFDTRKTHEVLGWMCRLSPFYCAASAAKLYGKPSHPKQDEKIKKGQSDLIFAHPDVHQTKDKAELRPTSCPVLSCPV